MARGRKATPGGLTTWELQIPTALAAEVELKLFDPLFNKPRYGARSKLLATLLAKWNSGEIQIPLDQ